MFYEVEILFLLRKKLQSSIEYFLVAVGNFFHRLVIDRNLITVLFGICWLYIFFELLVLYPEGKHRK